MRTLRRLLLTVLLAHGVAVPAPAGAQGVLDHLKCHTTKDPLRLSAAADLAATLQPEFSDSGCTIGKPKYFCVPATKQNVVPPPANPAVAGQTLVDDYVCYRLRCPTRPPDREVVDQFGTRTQTRYRSSLLCVPAHPTNTTTSTTTTTSSVTTTLPASPPCIGVPTLDPDGTVTTLVRGQPVDIPLRVTSMNGGLFTIFLYEQSDLGIVYCPQSGCGPHVFGACGYVEYLITYTPPPTAPASLTLVARADPHFFPFACGLGSQFNSDTKTFAVVDP